MLFLEGTLARIRAFSKLVLGRFVPKLLQVYVFSIYPLNWGLQQVCNFHGKPKALYFHHKCHSIVTLHC